MHFTRSSLAFACWLLGVCTAVSQDVTDLAPPKTPVVETLVIDGAALAKLRAKVESTFNRSTSNRNTSNRNTSNRKTIPGVFPALDRLVDEAEECLGQGPWTVVSKKWTPPSGDPHDYMSVGPYWWPDPTKKDGLPYIRRDGEVNPERMEYDNVGLKQTANNSLTLALAWYCTGESKYARHASELLRNWFLRPETRMNPNLNFGQAIPGRTKGRGIGIIDTTCLIRVVDAALILESSSAWSGQDATKLREWFDRYLVWLRTSPQGIDESRTKNNHATWYDAQVASFAIYAGQLDLARRVLSESAVDRIDSQIRSDGTMPLELERTKSWNYSVMNLRGFFTLATLAEHVQVDLWNYQSPSGGGIRNALDFLVPFATGKSRWKHTQISAFDGGNLAPLLRQASLAYHTPKYEQAIFEIRSEEDLSTQRFQITHYLPTD